MRFRLSSIRVSIWGLVAGARSAGSKVASSPTWCSSNARQSSSESLAPRWNGSRIRFGHGAVVAVRRIPQQKMAWEIHTLNADTRAARHLDVDQRQRDGDARAAIQHLVEEAVAEGRRSDRGCR